MRMYSKFMCMIAGFGFASAVQAAPHILKGVSQYNTSAEPAEFSGRFSAVTTSSANTTIKRVRAVVEQSFPNQYALIAQTISTYCVGYIAPGPATLTIASPNKFDIDLTSTDLPVTGIEISYLKPGEARPLAAKFTCADVTRFLESVEKP